MKSNAETATYKLDGLGRVVGIVTNGKETLNIGGLLSAASYGGRTDIFSFDEADLQFPHEPGRRHPEIIPDHHDRLDMLPIAVPKGSNQFRVLLPSAGMQPLLELVQDQQQPPLMWQDATPSQVRQRIDQVRPSGQFGTCLADALEKPGFGLFGGGFDVDRENVFS
jgi:hypothetical protein